MSEKQKGLERDSFNFENDYKKFEKIKNKYQGEIDVIKKELKTLGKVNEYSSPQDIVKYNELAAKQNAVIGKFTKETEGLNIIERQVDLKSRIEKYEKAYGQITTADAIAKAFALDYSVGGRSDLQLE